MAIIPNGEKIVRRTPNGSSNVVRMNTSEIGGGLDDLSSGLGSMAQRDSEFQSSKANLAFLKAKHEIEQELRDDPDYKTHENRYGEKLSKSLAELSVGISDPRARADFLNRGKVTTENGRVNINRNAFTKEADHEISGIDEDAVSAKEMYLGTNDPESLQLIKETMNSRYETAFKQGYITETQMSGSKRQWRDDTAISKLKMLEPEDRLLALKQNFAKDLPIDVRNDLKKLATAEIRESKAMDIVNEYMDKGFNEEEAQSRFDHIKDKKLRKEVESRWDYDYNKNKKAEKENQWEHSNNYAFKVLHEKFKTKDIPAEEWEDMDSSTKMYLKGLEAESVKPPTKSNPDLVLLIGEYARKEQWGKIAKIVTTEGIALSGSDRVKYGNVAMDGQMPIEIKDGLTDIQAISGVLATAEIKDDNAKNLILDRVADWRREYIQTHNKQPDTLARNKFLEDMVLDIPTEIGTIFDDTEKAYKLNDIEGDLENIRSEMKANEPKIHKKITDYFNENINKNTDPNADLFEQVPGDYIARNPNPTNEDYAKAYKILKGE